MFCKKRQNKYVWYLNVWLLFFLTTLESIRIGIDQIQTIPNPRWWTEIWPAARHRAAFLSRLTWPTLTVLSWGLGYMESSWPNDSRPDSSDVSKSSRRRLPRGSGTFREHSSRLRPTHTHTHTHHSIRVCSELTNRNTRVGYRFNLINSSSAYWFRFLSILCFDSNAVKTSEVKHLDIKHIYSGPLFARLRAVCVQNRAAWFWMNWDFFSFKWRL